jgi:hypothetical protein
MMRDLLSHSLNRMAPCARFGRRRAASPHRHRSRLVLECLEERWVPSTVTNLNDAGDGSLRLAIIDTPAGGTVDFQLGLSGTITLTTGELLINNDLTIAGPGADVITVSGNQASRVIEIAANSTVDLSGLTIANGQPTDFTANGGGILNGGTLTLTDCVLSGNSIFGESRNGGGGVYNTGTLTVTASTLSNNSAGLHGSGGGIYNAGTVSITGSALSGNSADIGGGLYNASTTPLTITSSTVSSNTATTGAGGIDNTFGPLTITSSILTGNVGEHGGGIANVEATLTITSSTLSNNSAVGGSGGGIENSADALTVTNSILSGNSALSGGGGGIDNVNRGSLTVSNCTLSGNSAQFGGGIYNVGSGPVAVVSSALSGNSALVNGGGIYNGSNLQSSATLTVTSSTLSGNSALADGGVIYNSGAMSNAILNVINSTLSGNSAATSGGGLYTTGTHASTSAQNSLLAGNTGPGSPDLFGPLNSQGYNLIGDGTGSSGFTNTDQVGTADMPIDPMLDPLQDNGGPTQTMALLSSSPALNAGDPGQLGVADQRGVVRTAAVNIGAYQASATAFVVAAPDTVTSGVPFDVTVTAVDPFGQVAIGYTGTVSFSTTDLDPGVVLPADYTFTPDDQGMHTFTDTGTGEITLITPGVQTLTVTDTSDNTVTGCTSVTVTSPDASVPERPAPSLFASTSEARSSGMASSALDLAFTALHQKETN